MSSQLGEATVAVRAVLDKLDQDLAGARKKINGVVDNIAKGAAGIIGTGLVTAEGAVVGFAAASINAFVPFQQQMNEVFTLMPGMTQDAMDKMTADVLAFSTKFGTLPEEVVPALYQAISAGVPPENVFTFLETAQKAAIGGVSDLTTSINGISSVVNAYGSDVIDATEASDLMFTAVKMGKTTFKELSDSLFNVIPTAASLGVEFSDVTAALAAMTAQGTPTSVATTQLRQLLVELSKDGSKAAKTFETLAGKSFAEFIAQGGSLQEALTMMEGAASDAGMRLSDVFSSVEAGNAALALTGPGAVTFTKNLAEMTNSAGAANGAFETMDAGIGRSLEKAKALGQTFLLTTGQSLSPMIDKMIELAQTAMPWVQDVMERAQPIFAAFAVELGEKLAPAGAIIVDAFNRMGQALGLTNENMSGADLLLKGLKGTLDLIVSSVEAAAVIFNLIADATEAFRAALDKIGLPISGVEKALLGLLNPLLAIPDAWNNLVSTISQPVDLPDWLWPTHSPPPLAYAFRDIRNELNLLPDFSDKFKFDLPKFPALAGASTGSGGGNGNTSIVNIDGVSATRINQGDPADEAIRLTVGILRRKLQAVKG